MSDEHTGPRVARRLAPGAALLLAILIGIGLAALKGRGYDLAYALGNASAPYPIVALLAGLLSNSRRQAVVAGVLATLLSLASFYWSASALYLGRLSLDGYILRWFVVGTVTGVIFGLAGVEANRHGWLLLAAPLLLFGEPAVSQVARWTGVSSAQPPSGIVLAALIEMGLGLVLAIVIIARVLPRRALDI